MRLKFVNFILLITILSPLPCFANPVTAQACVMATQGSASEILETALATLHNMYPIKIAGVPMGSAGELEDTSPEMAAYCGACFIPPLMEPQWGVSMSFWEPIAILEVTSVPYCFPTFSFAAEIDAGAGAFSFGNRPTDNQNSLITFQAHYIQYPFFSMLGLAKSSCAPSSSGVDFAYMSEYDPIWQNDLWASYLNPEVFLVSNPFAQLSCSIDSIAANIGFPLDFMWWCLGSWGSMYPIGASNVTATSDLASVSVAARVIYYMHKLLQMEVTIGPHMSSGICKPINLPLMRKSMYALVPAFPVIFPNRIVIGRSGLTWDFLDVPIANKGVHAIILYRKVECCYL
ncbi:MAG: TraU family protein [Deferribacteraceae bacterium]|jgi:conjugal transfer pilus assembly protein TraU|nr:TraU family protein [Deferribacteraceae bacterium]